MKNTKAKEGPSQILYRFVSIPNEANICCALCSRKILTPETPGKSVGNLEWRDLEYANSHEIIAKEKNLEERVHMNVIIGVPVGGLALSWTRISVG